jgi:hypothetical protein
MNLNRLTCNPYVAVGRAIDVVCKDGQFCIVLPEQDAVFAITANTGGMRAELNVVWDKLLSAFHVESPGLWQFSDAKFAELNRRTFALQAQEPFGRITACPTRYFFSIDPQPDLAVDRAYVVMIPVSVTVCQMTPGIAATAIR